MIQIAPEDLVSSEPPKSGVREAAIGAVVGGFYGTILALAAVYTYIRFGPQNGICGGLAGLACMIVLPTAAFIAGSCAGTVYMLRRSGLPWAGRTAAVQLLLFVTIPALPSIVTGLSAVLDSGVILQILDRLMRVLGYASIVSIFVVPAMSRLIVNKLSEQVR